MNPLRLLLAALVTCCLIPTAAPARDRPAPDLTAALRAFGTDYPVPAAWLGIWEDQDSVYSGCTPSVLLNTSTDRDTICINDRIDPDSTIVGYSCEGTVTETSIDLTCTGSVTQEGCTSTFSFHVVGTRTANTAVSVTTVRTSFSPPAACFGLPDQCTRIVTHSTRVGPAPPGCATPVQSTTWGNLKALHR